MQNAIIHIERKQAWADMLRSYKVWLNGRWIGSLEQGNICSFAVQSGYHEIYLTIDWCSSQRLPISVAPGEEVRLICHGKLPLFALYKITVGANDYIKLYRDQ